MTTPQQGCVKPAEIRSNDDGSFTAVCSCAPDELLASGTYDEVVAVLTAHRPQPQSGA